MFDQHGNAPAYVEKVSLGCLEINYSDLKYSEYWNLSLIFVTFISFNFTICLIYLRIYFSFNIFSIFHSVM